MAKKIKSAAAMLELPKPVVIAASLVCDTQHFLDLVSEAWPYLQVAAMADEAFGQSAATDSVEFTAALDGLRAFIKFAGEEGTYLRGFLAYHNQEQIEPVMRDLQAAKRLEALIARHSHGGSKKKQSKRFLPLLAECVREWHDKCNLSKPALSDNSLAIALMQKIGSAFGVEIGAGNYRKALAKSLTA